MPRTDLKTGDESVKFGRITVFNADGSINRQFDITLGQLQASLRKNAGPPAGVTLREYNEHRWKCEHRVRTVGDVERLADGRVRIWLDEQQINNMIMETKITMQPDDYTGVLPAISVTAQKVAELDTSKSSRVAGVDSIVDGVVQWRSR